MGSFGIGSWSTTLLKVIPVIGLELAASQFHQHFYKKQLDDLHVPKKYKPKL
jgi:hypothetical protein